MKDYSIQFNNSIFKKQKKQNGHLYPSKVHGRVMKYNMTLDIRSKGNAII